MFTVPVFSDQLELQLQPGLFLFLPEHCLDGASAGGSGPASLCSPGEPVSSGQSVASSGDTPGLHSSIRLWSADPHEM